MRKMKTSKERVYKCPLCKDVGWILSKDSDGYEWSTMCECLKRETERRKNPPREVTFDVNRGGPKYKKWF